MKKKILILFVILFLFLIVIYFYKDQKIAVLGYHSFYKDKSELKEDNPEFINDINSYGVDFKRVHVNTSKYPKIRKATPGKELINNKKNLKE